MALNAGAHGNCKIFLGIVSGTTLKILLRRQKKSCENAGEPVADHFADIGRMVNLGSGSEREMRRIARIVKKVLVE
jgi:hypothetical protein